MKTGILQMTELNSHFDLQTHRQKKNAKMILLNGLTFKSSDYYEKRTRRTG